MRDICISPSDLSYFWEDSKVGFFDKYVLEIKRPKQSFPSVFNTIDLCMKDSFEKKDFQKIVKNAPVGYICHDEINVKSKPIKLGKFNVSFKGKIDSLLIHEDKTCTIVDYKTTNLSEKLSEIYFLQLASYAFCLQNPEIGNPKTVKGLGLLVYSPTSFGFKEDKGNLKGNLNWVEILLDKQRFTNFLKKELEPLLNSDRESLMNKATYSDLYWQKYVNCFYLEDDETEQNKKEI